MSIVVTEIKTQNCSRCKQFEPEYQSIKSQYPNVEFKELVFGVDKEAMDYAQKHGIKSAPTFVIEKEDSVNVVGPENLANTLKEIC
jgi:protein-disulfide isomerase-like protein with CxxC motif